MEWPNLHECKILKKILLTNNLYQYQFPSFDNQHFGFNIYALINGSEALLIDTAFENHAAAVLEDLKKEGFWVVAADPEARQELFTMPDRLLQGDLAVVLGAEGRGLRTLVQATVDHPVRIPMRGQVASLNVATAGAVVLFELLRREEFSPSGS